MKSEYLDQFQQINFISISDVLDILLADLGNHPELRSTGLESGETGSAAVGNEFFLAPDSFTGSCQFPENQTVIVIFLIDFYTHQRWEKETRL